MSKTFRIALYPGDGIGVEVTEATRRVLEALQEKRDDFALEFESFPWSADYYFEHGVVAPENFLEVLKPFDAIFLGAVGDPERLPDHVTLVPLITMRQRFDQYACVRPARLLPGQTSYLAGKGSDEIDMVIVRENSEGEYVNQGGRFKRGTPDEVATQTAVHTRQGVERILRFGFELARKRPRRKFTMITKSNALGYAYVMWDEVLEALRPEFSDIEADRQHVDAAAMNFVRRPEFFDVVVASNLFGDILSDLSGGIAGGLGFAPSANINPSREYPSLFEPVHGSAPDIAGQDKANPIAALLSAAMMLEWLGLESAAEHLRGAIDAAAASGNGTPDMGGNMGTKAFVEYIAAQL